MFDKIKKFIFRKEERRNRFRDRDTVFFDLTDEDGFSYINVSDTINYIPVKKASPIAEKLFGTKIDRTWFDYFYALKQKGPVKNE